MGRRAQREITMTQDAKSMAKPIFQVDETGLLTVMATPAWWRAEAQEPFALAELALQLADAGDKARSPHVCGVIGRRTKRPCRFNTQYEPCPNHCPEPLPYQCAAPLKTVGNWCRMDLRDGGCSTHPETYDRYAAARRAEQDEQRRQEPLPDIVGRDAQA